MRNIITTAFIAIILLASTSQAIEVCTTTYDGQEFCTDDGR